MADNRIPIGGLEKLRLSAQERPLRLALSLPDGVRDDVLLPQRFIGKEAVCDGFEYRVLCVAESALLPLKNFIGVPAELRCVTDRGQLRRICGIVTEAASGQSDGGLATYQLVMRDALAVMERSCNTRVYRDRNEVDIVKTLVAEWLGRNAMLAATFALQVPAGLDEKFARRQFRMQHNESDAAFMRRLLQDRGIAWCFLPGLPDSGSATRSRHTDSVIGHTLFVFDDAYQLKRNAAGNVRFHRDAATEERDAITAWSAVRTLQPGNVALHSWDYKNSSASVFMNAEAQSHNDQGRQGKAFALSLEDYQVTAPHLGDDLRDLTRLGDARMAFHDYDAKSFHAEGGVRDLAVGEWFILQGHPEIDTHPGSEREFVVTSQHIAAQTTRTRSWRTLTRCTSSERCRRIQTVRLSRSIGAFAR